MRLAIRSVLRQTMSDFELLVVGDACSDDSEAVVAAFADERVRWFNLTQNHGSQWAPNNFGIERAAGRYIAYLGHDDLWWPTHLETLVATARQTGADVVAAMAVMYGPPGSGVRAASGLFPGGAFTPRYFFPPSSMLHERALIERAGPWRSPQESRHAVDHDLLLRFHEGGARFAATGELTVFKFNAAWRRNAYKIRDVSEQTALLARMESEGEALRRCELTGIVQAVIDERFSRVEVAPAAAGSATISHRLAGGYKGSQVRATALPALPAAGLRFRIADPMTGFEWHPLERRRWGLLPWKRPVRWRWTGPAPRSSFALPVRLDRPVRLSLHVVGVAAEDPETAFAAAQLLLHDRTLPTKRQRQADGTWLWSADLDPAACEGRPIETLTIHFPRPRRPIDLGLNEDRRWLGLAIGEVEIRPR